jgi:hypothetical protein
MTVDPKIARAQLIAIPSLALFGQPFPFMPNPRNTRVHNQPVLRTISCRPLQLDQNPDYEAYSLLITSHQLETPHHRRYLATYPYLAGARIQS